VRIKRFVAPDMRTALRMVREEQGPDAVILSNRPAEGGIEIVAATDYDESLVQQALRAAAPTLEPHSAPVVELHAPRGMARDRIAHIEPIHAAALVTEAAPNSPRLPASRAESMIAALSSPAPQRTRDGIAARARAVFRIGEAPAQQAKSETAAPTLAELVSTMPADTRPAPEAPRLPAGDDFRALLARLAESEASNEREVAIEAPVVEDVGIATANDTRRIDYTHHALAGLHQAMADGVDVLGYLHWSALDNYEWGSYRPTFGLISWNRETFERTAKPSLGWLGQVARANEVPATPDLRVGVG